jgi:hypothetical protein
MVSVLALCAVDHGFQFLSDQAKTYKHDMCCFFR